MTDIRQHLPAILIALRQHLARAGAPETLRAALRELLPASYEIGVGRLVNEPGRQSASFEVILSDRTISPAPPSPEEGCYDLGQALAVIVYAQEPDTQALRELLRAVASAKMLRSWPQQE